jgi:hypothetical protein
MSANSTRNPSTCKPRRTPDRGAVGDGPTVALRAVVVPELDNDVTPHTLTRQSPAD